MSNKVASAELKDFKYCHKCLQKFRDFNDLRRHKEKEHSVCAYCLNDKINVDDYLDHVIKEHPYLCVWCHLAGFYAPPTSGISREVEHMKKFHPHRSSLREIKIERAILTLDDFM
jgi:hypothetical protein